MKSLFLIAAILTAGVCFSQSNTTIIEGEKPSATVVPHTRGIDPVISKQPQEDWQKKLDAANAKYKGTPQQSTKNPTTGFSTKKEKSSGMAIPQ